jgi:hypothetical protein
LLPLFGSPVRMSALSASVSAARAIGCIAAPCQTCSMGSGTCGQRRGAAVARIAVAAAVAVAAVSVTVVWAGSQPSTGPVVVALYLPAAVGVLLLWRASIYTWRRAATRPRAFVVDEGRAFLLLPDRAVMRVVAFVLMCTFPIAIRSSRRGTRTSG